jgi:hypothetical protein
MQLQQPRPVRIPKAWAKPLKERMRQRRAENFSRYVRLLIEDDLAAAQTPQPTTPEPAHVNPPTH